MNMTGNTLLVATAGITVFVAVMPPLTEVRDARNNPKRVMDIRVAETAVTGLILAMGAAGGLMSGSVSPMIGASAVAIGLLLMYEYTLTTQ